MDGSEIKVMFGSREVGRIFESSKEALQNPISERWGKQICLNYRLLAGVEKLLKAPRDESRSIFLNNADATRCLPIN